MEIDVTQHAFKRVAIITGASSGIGAATARALAHEGFALVLAARRVEELERLAGELTAAGGVALSIPTDITDAAQIERLARLTVEQFGRIDLLVNNAGVNQHHRAAAASEEKLAMVLTTNLLGPIRMARAVLPTMLQQRSGHIINIGSVAGHIALPGSSLYAASKHGLRAWNNALRIELARQGIAVSLVSPGFIRTAMTSDLRGVPMIGAEAVAHVIVQLTHRPQREVVVPGSYRGLIWLAQSLPPPVVDTILRLLVRRARSAE